MMLTKTEKSNKKIQLIECPRDAMQGLHQFVPTELKINYINKLLKAGFHTLDFGSFVSPKAIPQMQDTAQVLAGLDLSGPTKLLAIVANTKGIQAATSYPEINYLGYPFSISETFQQRNTNSSIAQSLNTVEALINSCNANQKEAVIYLSMGFGNPYGDTWNPEIVLKRTEELVDRGATIISLADTVGLSTPEQIQMLLPSLHRHFPQINFGLHLHSTPNERSSKIEAAFRAGCTRFDSAVKGFGGCPMAADDLTGNIATEDVLHFFSKENIDTGVDINYFKDALAFSNQIFLT